MASAFICEECPLLLECIVCSTKFPYVRPPNSRGRLPRFCSDEHRRRRIRQQMTAYKAEGRYPRDGHRPGWRADYYARRIAKPFVCQHPSCGRAFTSKQDAAKYCSQACMAASISVILSARQGTRPRRPCEKCGELFKPSRPSRKQKAAGYVQRFCGYECAGMVPRSTAPNRRQREGKLRSSGYWHPVNPIVVFERDGWRCHLCGVKTPEHLRGTTDDRAPECDHIVPIAAGGAHTYENSACACRKCNHLKGAKPLGQLLLFG